jgi:hypothetical protein
MASHVEVGDIYCSITLSLHIFYQVKKVTYLSIRNTRSG